MIEIRVWVRDQTSLELMKGRYWLKKQPKRAAYDWTISRPSVLFGKNAPFIKA